MDSFPGLGAKDMFFVCFLPLFNQVIHIEINNLTEWVEEDGWKDEWMDECFFNPIIQFFIIKTQLIH